ncbi:GNAT family N-acetyltransferase [Alteribacillus sp. HJP-4]|uniref:GNAT family N-acetyltransferase n=1 Tax=Alteribacillus sp. HJP-4 TaxID=2775394 RepID=UPI0035CD0C63
MMFVPLKTDGYYFMKVIDLYCRLFGADPRGIASQIRQHAAYPQYKGYIALSGKQTVGYIYGYTSMKGQGYHELLAAHLQEAAGWLTDCMEVAELGVHPGFRRQGTAQKLLDLLFDQRQENKAVLTVRKNNYNAFAFYKKRGWEVIREGFYPNTANEFIIMGKHLRKMTLSLESPSVKKASKD